jgi:hypothetical protein
MTLTAISWQPVKMFRERLNTPTCNGPFRRIQWKPAIAVQHVGIAPINTNMRNTQVSIFVN